MTLKDILYVTKVAEFSSFSQAAESLYISQPALSQYIIRLEKELGVTLFNRAKNSCLSLTPAGDLLVSEGANLLKHAQELQYKLTHFDTQGKAVLHVGTTRLYSRHYLSRVLSSFHLVSQAEVCVEDMVSALEAEKMTASFDLDLCLVPSPVIVDGLDYQTISQEEVFLAIPNKQIEKLQLSDCSAIQSVPAIDLSQLREAPFIFLKKHSRFTAQALELCHEAGFVPNIVFETVSWDTLYSYVMNGLGVGFVPEVLIDQRNSDAVTFCRLREKRILRSLVMAYPGSTPPSLAALEFIETAKTVIGRIMMEKQNSVSFAKSDSESGTSRRSKRRKD
ncbi:MAG: LysR family transcriptional regulator [Gracilibacteraceae bacterium]|jgi:DNA-binding transcriptional LysR family regulator|nr:LysR family transcriptional regulator [Gracilibacteraceae bacterium]